MISIYLIYWKIKFFNTRWSLSYFPRHFSAINPMLYSVMSTKFRRAFRRILSCRSKGWQESRTEITFAAPSVANVIQNKGGSSKIEILNDNYV